MKKMTNQCKKLSLLALFFLIFLNLHAQNVEMIPTDNLQDNFVNSYKLVIEASVNDYHSTSSFFDTNLFPAFGEHSVYWSMDGVNKGRFVLPVEKSTEYESVSSYLATNYDWTADELYSLQFKGQAQSIAIFRSDLQFSGQSINWESHYFKYSIDSYLYANCSYFANEENIIANGFSEQTKLVIIPAFTEGDNDPKVYIDSVFIAHPEIVQSFKDFLQAGGTLYTEGNAAYFAAKLGYMDSTDFDYTDMYSSSDGMAEIQFASNSAPFSLLSENTQLYSSSIPKVAVQSENILATLASDNRPVYFRIQNSNGSIICNLGIPTAGGYPGLAENSRQLQYPFNAILSAFLSKVDVTRSVYNQIPDNIIAGDNAISYDGVDTFTVIVQLRNLSNSTITGIKTSEIVRDYFNFLDVTTAGVNYEFNEDTLTFVDITLNAHSELKIKYRLVTPSLEDSMHENVDNYITNSSLIFASENKTHYWAQNKTYSFGKYRNYADVMFSARIVADADVNWKNFLGLDYQPFKVFMIMENKERTSAVNTVYTQFVPKDVPFYWTDNSIDIPILKTPGGKFVDVLRGSNDEASPDYDMDNDGHPDVWLDTASIYPKGYTLTEDSVYWQNPWAHLKDSTAGFVFDDIDHDGKVAQDIDGDGIVDVEEPGDKIRVWKITWDIGTVSGYQYYDPYCSYELWIDPPDLVPLSKGVGYAYGNIAKDDNMFYPFASDIDNVDLSDTTWSYWMERDSADQVIWKNMILQSVSNYEGFAFVDTSYELQANDSLIGLVPQPHREFIAVVSMGGEEIDMTHPTPSNSAYSKINYQSIFGEDKTTPIRTTYTYYAPLPNPLQFEYLSNGFTITDPETKDTLQELPKFGFANINYEIDASTEYSYYWIRNVGYDVDYNDPSLAMDSVDNLGDGVFGYFLYEIPKGFGDYKITLPKKEDGTYDLSAIVQIDGADFEKWIDNPNTLNEVEIWESPFSYQVYVPQLLIPPALDDDNFDRIDDWIDDRGDRFQSETGYLHDAFMLGDGESYPMGSENVYSHEDFGYAVIDSGWYAGEDSTYGDDHFETLGKVHISVVAIYEGKGKEGPVEIGKGGTLVCEEIFGGSPWVIHSHLLNSYASGVNIELNSEIYPHTLQFGKDTVLIKHTIQDLDEPRDFDDKFAPYNSSYGYGNASTTVMVGGKDPCSLISPDLETFSIIDLDYEKTTVTLVPWADGTNPDLVDFPKEVSGTFVELKVEINNGTDLNWLNTSISPKLPTELGNSEVVMSYVAYPRPLVPGDDIGTFTAGWRFNQPEGEVLVKMSDTLSLLQPSRRAYFIYLIKLDAGLENGVYSVPFTCTGTQKDYTGTPELPLEIEVPTAQFSITNKTENGRPLDYQKMVIGQAALNDIFTEGSDILSPTQNVKWSLSNINVTDFDTLTQTLNSTVNGNDETIDMSEFSVFPTVAQNKLFVLEEAETQIDEQEDTLATFGEALHYTYMNKLYEIPDTALSVLPIGPMIEITRSLASINGVDYNGEIISLQDSILIVGVKTSARNFGNDLAQNVSLQIFNDSNYIVIEDSLPSNCAPEQDHLVCEMGTFIPGESKSIILYYLFKDNDEDDLTQVLTYFNSEFNGVLVNTPYYIVDSIPLNISLYDFKLKSITYEEVDDQKIKITAKAVNRGIPATNVQFDIVPVVDGLDQAPIGESVIYLYNNQQIAELSAEYALSGEASQLTFKGVIDYDNKYIELFESNNDKQIVIDVTTSGIEDNLSKYNFTIYPNPVSEFLNFSYNLDVLPQRIKIKIIDASGKLVEEQILSDYKSGQNTYIYNLPNLTKGTYFYQFEAVYKESSKLFNGLFVK